MSKIGTLNQHLTLATCRENLETSQPKHLQPSIIIKIINLVSDKNARIKSCQKTSKSVKMNLTKN